MGGGGGGDPTKNPKINKRGRGGDTIIWNWRVSNTKTCKESNLFYNNNFNKYDMNRFNILSFDKKYGNLASFRQDLNKLSRLKPRKSHTKEKRIIVLNSTLE